MAVLGDLRRNLLRPDLPRVGHAVETEEDPAQVQAFLLARQKATAGGRPRYHGAVEPSDNSPGTCSLCKFRSSPGGMARHARECAPRVAERAPRRTGNMPCRLFQILAESGPYWLLIEARQEAKLSELDTLLRDVWVECCGHPSAFEIERKRYYSFAEDPGRELMDVRLGAVLRQGLRFTYEYDFGSTTELFLRVVGEREGMPFRRRAVVLARNDPPRRSCGRCGAEARKVCIQCEFEERWLCGRCARKHECGEEMLLPWANSPRAGICAYGEDPCS